MSNSENEHMHRLCMDIIGKGGTVNEAVVACREQNYSDETLKELIPEIIEEVESKMRKDLASKSTSDKSQEEKIVRRMITLNNQYQRFNWS